MSKFCNRPQTGPLPLVQYSNGPDTMRMLGRHACFCWLVIVICLAGCSKDSGTHATNTDPGDSQSKTPVVEPTTADELNQTKKNQPAPITNDSQSSGAKSTDSPIPPGPPVNNEVFHDAINKAVDGYLQFFMVNSIVMQAPEDCRPPSEPEPKPRFSQSDDNSTHGKKLYYLFAKDINHYLNLQESTAPVGQTLVKESWTSKESNPGARNLRNHASGNRIDPRTVVDGKVVQISKRKDLFLMHKLEPDTPDTDNGWVYAVVDPDTKDIRAAGKIDSCIQCHESAEHDRLFGSKLNE